MISNAKFMEQFKALEYSENFKQCMDDDFVTPPEIMAKIIASIKLLILKEKKNV